MRLTAFLGCMRRHRSRRPGQCSRSPLRLPTMLPISKRSLSRTARTRRILRALYNRATQALYRTRIDLQDRYPLHGALENNVDHRIERSSRHLASMKIGNGDVTNLDNGRNYGEHQHSHVRPKFLPTPCLCSAWRGNGSRICLVKTAEDFGFDQDIEFDLPLAKSLMPKPEEMTEWETAWAAAGEPVGEHESPAGPQSTVLEMAMVGCAIANEWRDPNNLIWSMASITLNGKCSFTASAHQRS